MRFKNSAGLRVALVGLSLSALCISACEGVGIGPFAAVQGSGNVKTEARNVTGFNSVTFDGSGTLVITQGSSEQLSITAEDNILPHLRSVVRDGRLTLGPRPGTSFHATRPIRYELGVKQLNAISVRGSGDVQAASLDADQIDISITGSGSASIGGLTATVLNVTVTGSGDVTVSGGQAARQNVMIEGSGRVSARDLVSQQANVQIAGSGDCAVRVSDSLSVTISGSGSVTYLGSPSVNQQILGSGKVTKAG